MRKILLILTTLFFIPRVEAQEDSAYQALIARAGLFHLQKDYKNAIGCFEKAFSRQQPDALNAYKAAGAYSLDSNMEKAFDYISLALQRGWREADQLAYDPYFDYLRKVAPEKWKQTEETALKLERQYESGLALPDVRKKINRMTLTDQRLRYARVQATGKEERQRISRNMHISDSLNRVAAKAIFKQYGWPAISAIGKDGQNNFWLMIQHADDDLPFQQAALSAMRKLKATGEVNLENYAFLFDRVRCNLNYKQWYGTQVNWASNGKATGFRRIDHEEAVDRRRAAIGLLPLRLYALTYGFDYTYMTTEEANRRDSAERQGLRDLITDAGSLYRNKDFQQMYDCYDKASMILSGMSNAENYQAAILFARVATQNKDDRFSSMALDFLNLLYLRHALDKNKLKMQPAFRILYKNPRWMSIYGDL